MDESKEEILAVDFGQLRLILLAMGFVLVFTGTDLVFQIFAVASRLRTETAIELVLKQSDEMLNRQERMLFKLAEMRDVLPLPVPLPVIVENPVPLPVKVESPVPVPVLPVEPVKPKEPK